MLYDNLSINEKGHLVFAGYDTVALAEEFGTPLYVMDEEAIRARCRLYKRAMEKHLPDGSHPLYASKALSFQGIYRIMEQEGMRVDAVSMGEIHTARKAGFFMENVFFHGNSKTDEAIAYAMSKGVGWIVCDNAQELLAVERAAGDQMHKVLLRLTPGIDPHTHGKINTGRVDSKFGAAMETGQAEELTRLAMELPHVAPMGYHCHIGSQIFEKETFVEAARIMMEFSLKMLDKIGYFPHYLNLGGGMAVRYQDTDPMVDYEDTIAAVGKLIDRMCQENGIIPPAVFMEPGRSIVAEAGLTLYTVTGTKKIPGFKNYVAVDGGMTDNPRYTLYNAPYTVLPASRMNDPAQISCTVAGWCCESGDILQENVLLPEAKRGDTLAVLTTGAYNYSMASNYNRMPRPAIVIIGKDGPYVAVRRETLEDLTQYDM